jgi:hypothetical protein
MRRRPNDRPTNIYWLVDMRPETIAAGWHSGRPFYCGKTVDQPIIRLGKHRGSARQYPKRPVSEMLRQCGEQVRIQIMEVVPVGGDWVACEKRWIRTLRFSFPDIVNVSNGGEGPTGIIRTAEYRAKISKSLTGKKLSPEHRAKCRAAKVGQIISAEHRAKISAAKMGHRHSEETKAKIREVLNAPGMRAKISERAKAGHATRKAMKLSQ